jgi:hypothetical protein
MMNAFEYFRMPQNERLNLLKYSNSNFKNIYSRRHALLAQAEGLCSDKFCVQLFAFRENLCCCVYVLVVYYECHRDGIFTFETCF